MQQDPESKAKLKEMSTDMEYVKQMVAKYGGGKMGKREEGKVGGEG